MNQVNYSIDREPEICAQLIAEVIAPKKHQKMFYIPFDGMDNTMEILPPNVEILYPKPFRFMHEWRQL